MYQVKDLEVANSQGLAVMNLPKKAAPLGSLEAKRLGNLHPETPMNFAEVCKRSEK
jgi:hypothetical protein